MIEIGEQVRIEGIDTGDTPTTKLYLMAVNTRYANAVEKVSCIKRAVDKIRQRDERNIAISVPEMWEAGALMVKKVTASTFPPRAQHTLTLQGKTFAETVKNLAEKEEERNDGYRHKNSTRS